MQLQLLGKEKRGTFLIMQVVNFLNLNGGKQDEPIE